MLVRAHSGLRYVVLILLIFAIYNALTKRKSNSYKNSDNSIYSYAMIFCHVQLLLGLILYFFGDKVQFNASTMSNSFLRFYAVEHISMMLIALVLITIGRIKSKKKTENNAKHSTIFTYYLIGLLLILISIPWPFRDLGGSWF
jgi:putative Ca2+/H+ antiporter (TMEM165/GDT1 family)